MSKTPELSIIVPMYNEEDSVALLFETLIPMLDNFSKNWEIVCIDDGSNDATYAQLCEHAQKEKRIRALSLSRNFGKEAALTAGLEHAHGSAVIPIDADLQDPPEVIGEMLEKWRNGAKVVIATRHLRVGDPWTKRVLAKWYYRVLGKLTNIRIPANTGDFRLMDREVVEAMQKLPERTRFMKGLFAWVGYPTEQVFYDRPARASGQSKFSFTSLWALAMDGIFSFTTLPLKIWTYIGAIISLLSILYACFLIITTLIHGTDVPGYASLMVAILFMGGIQLISLGVIGEYVARIYRETKQRPLYLVKDKQGF